MTRPVARITRPHAWQRRAFIRCPTTRSSFDVTLRHHRQYPRAPDCFRGRRESSRGNLASTDLARSLNRGGLLVHLDHSARMIHLQDARAGSCLRLLFHYMVLYHFCTTRFRQCPAVSVRASACGFTHESLGKILSIPTRRSPSRFDAATYAPQTQPLLTRLAALAPLIPVCSRLKWPPHRDKIFLAGSEHLLRANSVWVRSLKVRVQPLQWGINRGSYLQENRLDHGVGRTFLVPRERLDFVSCSLYDETLVLRTAITSPVWRRRSPVTMRGNRGQNWHWIYEMDI
jgi:hypothetical protein